MHMMRLRKGSALLRTVLTSAVSVAALTAIAVVPASAGSVGPNTRPVIAGRSGGVAHPNPVESKRFNRNVTNKTGPQSETTVAVDPLDAHHYLAASNDLTGSLTTHVYESTDAGRTWTVVNTGITGFCYDPWLDFNAAGDAFFAYECSDQRIGYRLHGTNNWVLTTLAAGGFPDRDMVVTDDNPASPFYKSVYVGYDDANAGNSAFVMYSRNGQTGWTKSPKINDTAGAIGVNVAVAPDGSITASWLDWANSKIWVDRSTNGGVAWSTDHLVHQMVMNTGGFFIPLPPTPHRGIVAMPFTDASPVGTPHAGRVYVSYEDRKAGGGTDTNVYVTSSDNGGTTWSTPAQVNDDGGTAYQFFPAIAVRSDGLVGLTWYDTRNDGTSKKTDQYFSSSLDGATWSANKKVTNAQSDESGSGADGNDYGDYEGLDVGPAKFAPIWTDSRPGTLNEDMYFGKVRA
jgi:hypothetical protein